MQNTFTLQDAKDYQKKIFGNTADFTGSSVFETFAGIIKYYQSEDKVNAFSNFVKNCSKDDLAELFSYMEIQFPKQTLDYNQRMTSDSITQEKNTSLMTLGTVNYMCKLYLMEMVVQNRNRTKHMIEFAKSLIALNPAKVIFEGHNKMHNHYDNMIEEAGEYILGGDYRRHSTVSGSFLCDKMSDWINESQYKLGERIIEVQSEYQNDFEYWLYNTKWLNNNPNVIEDYENWLKLKNQVLAPVQPILKVAISASASTTNTESLMNEDIKKQKQANQTKEQLAELSKIKQFTWEDKSKITETLDKRIAEAERIAAEKIAEAERIAEQKIAAAAEKIAEAERIAEQKIAAAAEKIAEQKRIAAEKIAEAERIAEQKIAAAAEKIAEAAAEKIAEAERIAAKKIAEAERIAAKKIAEAERIAAKKIAAAEKIAAEKIAEAERIAAEKIAEAEKIAAEKIAEAEQAPEPVQSQQPVLIAPKQQQVKAQVEEQVTVQEKKQVLVKAQVLPAQQQPKQQEVLPVENLNKQVEDLNRSLQEYIEYLEGIKNSYTVNGRDKIDKKISALQALTGACNGESKDYKEIESKIKEVLKICSENQTTWVEKSFLEKIIDILSFGIVPLIRLINGTEESKKMTKLSLELNKIISL
jgi:hypothetical protein